MSLQHVVYNNTFYMMISHERNIQILLLVAKYKYCNNGVLSTFLPVKSGVPQGSILGPLLCILCINDLPIELYNSSIFLFADDTKGYKIIRSPTDRHLLQQDLDNICNWSRKWKLGLNSNKCSFTQFQLSHSSELPSYFVDGSPLTYKECHKDPLNFFFSSDLSWSKHYGYILSKAYQQLGLLRRTFSTSFVDTKRQLYLSFVRSQLTYCSQLWRPHLTKDILLIERVQRRATKYILGDFNSDYKTRLLKLRLLPLMMEFEISDVLFFVRSYQYPTNSFDITDYVEFLSSNTRASRIFKLRHLRSSNSSKYHSYFSRLPRLWNSLPPIDPSSPIAGIKTQLRNILKLTL